MARYARLEEDLVVEVLQIHEDLEPGKDIFTKEFAASLKPCAAAVSPGWTYRNNEFHAPVAPEDDLDALKVNLCRAIDITAEAERLRYITGGAGQAMTYAQKAEEARLCLDAIAPGAEHYPLLAAEIGITADTLAGVAQVVATANVQWLQIGAAIEAARLSAKKAISEAETLEDARAAAAAVVWP